MNIWRELQIAETSEISLIRKAYAGRLKKLDLEAQPEAFQKLRAAYEYAMDYARGIDETPEENFRPIENDSMAHEFGSEAEVRGENVLNEATARQNNTALEMTSNLWRTLTEQGETAALQKLAEILGSDDLMDLDLKSAFELALADRFIHEEHVPRSLLRGAVDAFEWNDPRSGLEKRHPDLSWQLQPKIEEMEYYEAMLQMADKHLVPRILTGPYRPAWFLGLAVIKSGKIVSAVLDLLDDLENTHPAIFHHDLDASTIRWWREAKSSTWIFLIQMLLWFTVIGLGIYAFISSGNIIPLAIGIGLLRGLMQ